VLTSSIAISVPGPCRARVVLGAALALACLVGGGASASAASASTAAAAHARVVTVCAPRATLYETPGGAKVGILHSGDRVRVLATGDSAGWWRVVAGFGTRGWLRRSAICERHR
jgi:hypothetical protein